MTSEAKANNWKHSRKRERRASFRRSLGREVLVHRPPPRFAVLSKISPRHAMRFLGALLPHIPDIICDSFPDTREGQSCTNGKENIKLKSIARALSRPPSDRCDRIPDAPGLWDVLAGQASMLPQGKLGRSRWRSVPPHMGEPPPMAPRPSGESCKR